MLLLFWQLLLGFQVATTALPGAREENVQNVQRRGLIGPISTSSATGIAGGTVASDAPPVSSFFDGLKPPVRQDYPE